PGGHRRERKRERHCGGHACAGHDRCTRTHGSGACEAGAHAGASTRHRAARAWCAGPGSTAMMFRAVSGLFALLAFWAAYLQLNDPDPERWFVMYAAAGVVGVLFAAGRPRAWPALAVAVI